MPKISIVVCTFNRAESLRETLKALSAQVVRNGLTLELLIVDNHSTDETKAVVEAAARTSRWPMRYLYELRQGKSFALNTGIAAATGETLAFTDDDIIPTASWVQALHDALATHQADCAGGKILLRWLTEPPAWLKEKQRLWTHLGFLDRGDEVHRVELGEGGWVWGGNVAFKRTTFDRVGTFRTDLGPQGNRRLGGEDGEMVRRVALHHGKVIYQPAAVVYHVIGSDRASLGHFRRLRFYEGISRQRVWRLSHSRTAGWTPWRIRTCVVHGLKSVGAYAQGKQGIGIEEELCFWTELGLIVGAVGAPCRQ